MKLQTHNKSKLSKGAEPADTTDRVIAFYLGNLGDHISKGVP